MQSDGLIIIPTTQQVCYVVEKLAKFIQDGGGSFRKMMEYLDIEPRHYSDLYNSGGMLLSNTIATGIEHEEAEL